jgi:DNA-binding winged helix-turn-helix (wHTH) protein/Tfp pilus assembly protein PilF
MSAGPTSFEFDGFLFDAADPRLEYNGDAVHLPPKSLHALSLLLENAGNTVSRDEFLEKVWSGSVVEDANLTVTISLLRKTFIGLAGKNYIETVPRRGYRFTAVVDPTSRSNDEATETANGEALRRPVLHNRRARNRVVYLALALIAVVLSIGALAAFRSEAGSSAANSSIPDANAAFQRGEALYESRANVCDGIPHFREAISKDERFARAYARLAATLTMCADRTDEASFAIKKALEIAPRLAEVQATDGFIKMFRNWDWAGAEASLREAVALEANSAMAHHWLGVLLSIRGRFPEARAEIARAVELEPASPLYRADLCQVSYLEMNVPRALTECREAEKLDPDFLFTGRYFRDIYLLAGDEQKAWEYETRVASRLRDSPEMVEKTEELVKREGFRGLYERTVRGHLAAIENSTLDANSRFYSAMALAESYSLLRDRENALYWLEQIFVEGGDRVYPFSIAYLGVDPRVAFLRGEPRFQAILRRIKLIEN